MAEYIKREDIVAKFQKLKDKCKSLKNAIYLDGVIAVLDSIPAADVAEVRHGRWEFPIFADSDNELDPRVKCSECGEIEMAFARWKYCPNCGAKMEGE